MIDTLKKHLTWPWIVSVPLLLGGFILSVFFVGTDSPLLAPSIACLFLFAIVASYRNFIDGWAFPRSNTFYFAMAFWAWVVLSLSWTTTPYVSTIFTIILSLMPGIFAISIMAQKRDEWANVHATAMWLAVCGFAVWAVIQFFVPSLYAKFGPRIHHPLLDPNSLAGLLNLAIAPAIGVFMLSKGRIWVALTGALMVIFYMGLIVTQSRAGFACCVASVLIFLPFTIWRNPAGWPWKKLLFILVAGVLVPLILSHAKGEDTLRNLVGTQGMVGQFGKMRSMEDRFYLWGATWHMIKDHFWFGTGLASFYFYYPRYRVPLDRSDGFFAHMDPLQYWAEMGVLAPLLFYGTLICVLIRTVMAMRKAEPGDIASRVKIMGAFCGMLALTAHAHVNYHLYMPGLLLPLSVLLAYWYMATEKVLGDGVKRVLWKPQFKVRIATAGLCLFIGLMACGWIARTSLATIYIGKVQRAVASNHVDDAKRNLQLVGMIAPPSYGRYPEYEARMRVGLLWSHAKNLRKEEVQRLYDEAIKYLDQAEGLNPAFTTVWDLRARLQYAVDGIVLDDGKEQAIRGLTRVIENNPLAADSRIGLANIYAQQGDLQKAAYVLESGMKWPRPKGATDLNYLLTLANLKLKLGDKKGYVSYYNEAVKRSKWYGIPIRGGPQVN